MEPQTYQPSSIRAFEIVMIVTPVLAVVLRFWSRALVMPSKGPKLWWDDWIALAAVPFSVVSNALLIYLVSLGFGRHIKTIPSSNVEQLLKVLWVSYIMGDTCLTLTKISALLLYQRIFTSRSPWFRYALWVGYALAVLWWISAIIRVNLFCEPVDKYWQTKKPGFCRSSDDLYIGSAVPSVVIDLYILLLPIPQIWQLQLNKSKKLFISGVLICGYGVVAISLGRLIFTLSIGTKIDKDLTYYGVPLLYLIAAEPALSIYCICMPVIYFLARRVLQKGPASIFNRSMAKSAVTDSSKVTTSKVSNRFSDADLELTRPHESDLEDSDSFAEPAYRHKPAVATISTAEYLDNNREADIGNTAIHVQRHIDVHSERSF